MFGISIKQRINNGVLMSIRTHKRKSINALTRVQLLQDVDGVGYKGEIIKVKPGFMRNYLHIDNKACYINEKNGPRIPVVDRDEIREKKRKEAELLKQEQQEEIIDEDIEKIKENKDTLTLGELSDLFSNMSKNKKNKINMEKTFEIKQNLIKENEEELQLSGDYEEAEILKQNLQSNKEIKIPKIITITTDTLPINKTTLFESINKHQDNLVESLESFKISYIDTPNEHLEIIEDKGRYQIKFQHENEERTTTIEIE
ncbi:unnamed protein product [Candida verbasci]|uniref:Ribosomal protein L9 domain-containing protein n=1 Tax=Candida verbasci TaxID=1227364 RepID=A0A9W4TTM5_9ASCO|nr:unnamed protein product [Candida verbasci]